VFRLDVFTAGLRYKPLLAGRFEPFVGVGLDYYHFSDRCGEQDFFSYFVLPVNSAIGPYIQGGFYARALKPLQVQCFVKYNLVRHTEKRSTYYGTYHYRTDFSGLGFGLGILFCIHGK
jgi:outer membrane protein W